jgi:hypothetical protein
VNFINKQLFIKTINTLKKQRALEDKLSKAMVGSITTDYFCIQNNLEPTITNILSYLTSDESDWIGYYIYELDFGRKWKKGKVTFDNKDIKLKTPNDLWKIIQNKQQS